MYSYSTGNLNKKLIKIKIYNVSSITCRWEKSSRYCHSNKHFMVCSVLSIIKRFVETGSHANKMKAVKKRVSTDYQDRTPICDSLYYDRNI